MYRGNCSKVLVKTVFWAMFLVYVFLTDPEPEVLECDFLKVYTCLQDIKCSMLPVYAIMFNVKPQNIWHLKVVNGISPVLLWVVTRIYFKIHLWVVVYISIHKIGMSMIFGYDLCIFSICIFKWCRKPQRSQTNNNKCTLN